MKVCEEYLDLILQSADGTGEPRDVARLEAHLQDCAGCRNVYESLIAVDQGIQNTEEEPPDTLHGAVMGTIRREQAQRSPRTWLKRGKFTLLAAAAAVLLIVVSRTNVQFRPPVSTEAPAGTAPAVSAELRSIDKEPAAETTLQADAGGVGARVVAAELDAGSLLEQMEAIGCTGDIYFSGDVNEAELLARFDPLEVLTLSDGAVAYGVDAEALAQWLSEEEIPIIDTGRLGDSGEIAWLVLV